MKTPEQIDKDLNDKQVEVVVRAFWRRIEKYKNHYGSELPDPLPVEFAAHMRTALLAPAILKTGE